MPWVSWCCAWLRIVLFAAAATELVGCARGVAYKHVLAASPDGHRLLMGKGDLLQLYDLATEQRSWRQHIDPYWLSGSHLQVAWSQNGEYFALGTDRFDTKTRGYYAVWERATGRRISPVYVMYGVAGTVMGAPAISNDGRWFAASGAAGEQVYDNRSGNVVLKTAYGRPSFAADSRRLVCGHQLLELHGSVWTHLAELPTPMERRWAGNYGADSAWVGRRLAVARDGAVELWDGVQVTHRMSIRGSIDLAAGDRLLAIIEPIDVSQAKYLGHTERLTVYDAESGQKRFVRSDLGSELQVVFRGDQVFVRGFRATYDTFVYELDSATGRTLAKQGFGRWGGGKRAIASVSFYPSLLPLAYYIDLADDGHDRYEKLELR